MPTNLNALIRYKRIDRELRNNYVKTTIESLQQACSDQLAEHRGIYKLVSERTIRDDIRIMRSDALGFNAPIVVEDGVYSYSIPDFSIFKTSIDNMDLLKDIFQLLLTEKDNITNPQLAKVLKSLSKITGMSIHSLERGASIKQDSLFESNNTIQFDLEDSPEAIDIRPFKSFKLQLFKHKLKSYSWGKIFELLTLKK